MPESFDEIIAKVRKVKRLMEAAGTEGEMAAAAAAMQRLLQRYNLDLSQISATEGSGESDVDEQRTTIAKESEWRLQLISAVMDANFCKALHIPMYKVKGGKYQPDDPVIVVIGAAHNREVALFMYKALEVELLRLVKNHGLDSQKRGLYRHEMSPRKSFLYGAAITITQRLKEEQEAFKQMQADGTAGTVPNERALAVLENTAAKIDEYMYKHEKYKYNSMRYAEEQQAERARQEAAETPAQRAARLAAERRLWKTFRSRRGKSSKSLNYDAYNQGKTAGRTVRINHGRGELDA